MTEQHGHVRCFCIYSMRFCWKGMRLPCPITVVGMYRNGDRDFLTNHLFPIPLLSRVSPVPVDSLRIQPWLRRAQISCVEMWSKPQGASKLNRYPPPVMSFFLALNVQTSLMHIWNWFETHSAAGWCCIEGEVTKKKSPNNRKWWRAWRLAKNNVQKFEKDAIHDVFDLPDSDLWSVDGFLRAVTATHLVENCVRKFV